MIDTIIVTISSVALAGSTSAGQQAKFCVYGNGCNINLSYAQYWAPQREQRPCSA